MASTNTFALARTVAPVAFLYNIGMQTYGVAFSSPSIAEIHEENLSFFSPLPIFIGVAFSSVMVLQGVWLWKLVRNGTTQSTASTPNDAAKSYLAINILGNLSLGTWVFFWISSHLLIADVFVLISTVAHLGYLFFSPTLRTNNATNHTQSQQVDPLTRAVVGGFAALGVLDLLHNTSIAVAKDQAPGVLVKVLTGIGFVGLSVAGDGLFGAALVFDLLALAAGQAKYNSALGLGWSGLLGLYAVVCGVIVGGKWVWPRYIASKSRDSYAAVATRTSDDEERV